MVPEELWYLYPSAFLLLAAAVGIAALWPPLSRRRIVTAVILFCAGAAVYAATFMPVVALPTHFVVVAECKAFEKRAEFEKSLTVPLGDRQILSEVNYLVLEDEGCPAPDPSRQAAVVPGSSFASAMRAASDVYDMAPVFASWRAKRLILVGVPGGTLSEARAESEELLALEFLATVERLEATVEYLEIGAVPDRRMTVTAPVWRAMPVGKSWAPLRLDLTDDEIHKAKEIRLEYVQHALTAACTVKAQTINTVAGAPHVVIRADLLAKDGTYEKDKVRVDWPDGRSGRRLVLTVDLDDDVADRLRDGTCHDSWWTFVEVTATATLDDGEIVFRGSTGFGRANEPMLTLVTPAPGTPADHRAAAGWERTVTELVDPESPFGLSDLLEAIRADRDRDEHFDQWRWPWRTLWLAMKKSCWFRGLGELAAREDDFKQCLGETRRLATISADKELIAALESIGVGALVEGGQIETLVAAPEYNASDIGDLPDWAVPEGRWNLATTAMPIIVASMSDNALITRRPGARPERQSDVLRRFKSPGMIGGAEGDSMCNADSPEEIASPGLFWFALKAPSTPVPPVSTLANPQAQLRLRGVLDTLAAAPPIFPTTFSTNPGPALPHRARMGSADTFRDNLFCDHPVKRAIDAIVQLEKTGLYKPGSILAPRATVLLFDTDMPTPHFDAAPAVCDDDDSSRYLPGQVARRLNEFAQAGGHILLQPVGTGTDVEREFYEFAVKGLDPSAASAAEHLGNLLMAGNKGALRELPVMSDHHRPEQTAATILDAAARLWSAPSLAASSFDHGALGTRNAGCVYDPTPTSPADRFQCLYSPPAAGGPTTANALNRTVPVPEFFRDFPSRGPKDRLLSGQLYRHGSNDTLRQIVRIGRGKSTILGYSPFARDQLAQDFLATPRDARLRKGLCFLMDRAGYYSRSTISGYGAFPADGGMKLLDRFARAWDIAVDAPIVDGLIDRDPETGAFTLVAYAHVSGVSRWTWKLGLSDKDGNAFAAGTAPASLIMHSFNPTTGEARIRVVPRIPGFRAPLRISLSDAVDVRPTLLPVYFPDRKAEINLSKLITLLDTERSSAARLTIDTTAASIMLLVFSGLAMLSPLARSWSAARSHLARRFKGKLGPVAELRPRAAQLSSLEAALSEWGAHPGQPAAARSAGLPSGIRQWRAGDVGRAIRPATLYGLLGQNPAVPPMKPRVRLKTAPQATSVLVLVDGSGALSYPIARRSPPKTEFAATLAAFLAGAATMSHGRAEVMRVGITESFAGEPQQLEVEVRAALKAKPSFERPVAHMQRHGGAALVFFLVDGLSANELDLVELAQTLGVDGNKLRVAAIVCGDDRFGATLSRNPRSGRFEDASEVHPKTYLRLRDERLEKLRHALDRWGSQLVVFPTEATTQELLKIVGETGFLA